MDEILDEFDHPQAFEELTDQEIFTRIWTSPRPVFNYIYKKDYRKHMAVLLVLAGISRALDRAALRGTGDNMSLAGVLLLCIGMGALLGWISYYIYAALLSWTGKWLGGEGTTSDLVNMMAYASVPAIAAMLFLVPQIVVYGNAIFESNGNITDAGLVLNVVVWGSMALELILGIWSIVLIVVGISVVQDFSIGKSIGNLLLPIFIIALPILLIILLVT